MVLSLPRCQHRRISCLHLKGSQKHRLQTTKPSMLLLRLRTRILSYFEHFLERLLAGFPSLPNSCLGTHVFETPFRVPASTRNRVSQTGLPKQEFGNEMKRYMPLWSVAMPG